MQIFIQARGFDLSAGFARACRASHSLRARLGHQHVRKVSIRLSDLNGPRGGEDKRCSIQVAVPGAADVLIEDTEPDLYVAIDRAADRAGRTLARQVARQREYRHDSPRDGNTKNAAIAGEAESTSAASPFIHSGK
jgi:putative sigma-54 modulation protein